MLDAVFLSMLEGLELSSKTLEHFFGFQPTKNQQWKYTSMKTFHLILF